MKEEVIERREKKGEKINNVNDNQQKKEVSGKNRKRGKETRDASLIPQPDKTPFHHQERDELIFPP